MKKLLFIVFTSILLTACNSNHSSTLSISEIEDVPDDVQSMIDSTNKLQLINKGDKTSYIVYQSNGEVDADIEKQEDLIHIKLKVTKDDNKVLVQHVFKITSDHKYHTIEASVNGEPTPFDNVAS